MKQLQLRPISASSSMGSDMRRSMLRRLQRAIKVRMAGRTGSFSRMRDRSRWKKSPPHERLTNRLDDQRRKVRASTEPVALIKSRTRSYHPFAMMGRPSDEVRGSLLPLNCRFACPERGSRGSLREADVEGALDAHGDGRAFLDSALPLLPLHLTGTRGKTGASYPRVRRNRTG